MWEFHQSEAWSSESNSPELVAPSQSESSSESYTGRLIVSHHGGAAYPFQGVEAHTSPSASGEGTQLRRLARARAASM